MWVFTPFIVYLCFSVTFYLCNGFISFLRSFFMNFKPSLKAFFCFCGKVFREIKLGAHKGSSHVAHSSRWNMSWGKGQTLINWDQLFLLSLKVGSFVYQSFKAYMDTIQYHPWDQRIAAEWYNLFKQKFHWHVYYDLWRVKFCICNRIIVPSD